MGELQFRLRTSPMSPDGKCIETTKKLAAKRQIHAAILLLRKEQEFECAITLAAAAEGLLPTTDDPHIFKILKDTPVFKQLDLNLFMTDFVKWAFEKGHLPVPVS